MSTTPNNPFENTQGDQSFAQGPPQKKGSNVWIWVIGIVGVVGLVGAIACCGGFYALYSVGTGMMAETYKPQLDGNPVIVQHIGEIESLEMNLSRTAQEGQNSNQGMIAFDIVGSKASGTIMIRQDSSGGGTGIAAAELILADGSRHEVLIEPNDQFGGMEDFEVDLGDVELGEVDAPVSELEVSIPESGPDE